MKKTQIIVDIELDENHIPEKMQWSAEDGGVKNEETKAVMVSVWDDKDKEALRIDLWTKEMPMDDMKRFYHQIFISMANSYQRATNEDQVADFIIDFAENFAQQSGIKSKK